MAKPVSMIDEIVAKVRVLKNAMITKYTIIYILYIIYNILHNAEQCYLK